MSCLEIILSAIGLIKPPEIRLTNDGIYFKRRKVTWFAQWEEIIRVVGFKGDLFAVDTICLHVIIDDNRNFVVCEEDDVWEKINDELPRQLNGFPEEWQGAIIQPPFAENATVLYVKADIE